MEGDRYSRIVAWAKILLPLGALGLLATLFLFARAPVPDGPIPFAEIEDIARDPRIGAPAMAAVTPEGAAVTFGADSIRPVADRPDAFVIEGLHIGITVPGGETLRIIAASGDFDGRTGRVALDGLARIESTAGYRMETNGLDADLVSGRVETRGPLAVRAPFGELDAGRLRIAEGGTVMVFNGGVRLLYRNGTEGAPP
ncbi:MAG: hypothetical protein IT542_03285 [Rubellimicrobium sp.]|nr:hypothetical protein [Rubellimicrobium sp.]